MKPIALTVAVAAAAFIFAAQAGAHIPRSGCNNHLTPRAELLCARRNVYHAQGVIQWARSKALTTRRLSTDRKWLDHLVRDHQWLYRTMSARVEEAKQRQEAKRRQVAATAFPPHHALWVCLGSYEGSPTSVNPNGHYGMLQMHWDWGYGIVGAASKYSQQEQEWAAERGYKASGYSRSFLYDQWLDYDHAYGCLAYA